MAHPRDPTQAPDISKARTRTGEEGSGAFTGAPNPLLDAPPETGLPPVATFAGQRMDPPRDAPEEVEQALLEAMHLLTSSKDVDLLWLLDRFARAMSAEQLALYVLVSGDVVGGLRARFGEGSSEKDVAPVDDLAGDDFSEDGLEEPDSAAAADGSRQARPSRQTQPASAPAEGHAPTPEKGPSLPAAVRRNMPSRKQRARASVRADHVSQQEPLLEEILRERSSGWLIPILSPTQGLHGYLDALPAASRADPFDAPQGRALHYLCSLLAGYLDRWENRWKPRHSSRPRRLHATAAEQEEDEAVSEAPAADRRVVEALEEQQEHISRELHDSVGQLLTSIRMLGENLADGRAEEDAAQSRADRIAELAGKAAEQVSEIHRRLCTPDLCETTLASALETLAERMNELSDAYCFFHCDETDLGDDLDEEVKLQLYRIAQEATHNAVKHAYAERIQVALEFEEAGNPSSPLVLRVQDDGEGFDLDGGEESTAAGGSASSSGLRNMKARARAAGGTLQIESTPGTGTTITGTVPGSP
jgi:signal transduction histidine kinase